MSIFRSQTAAMDPYRLAFWGNLSYFNNIRAISWFYNNVFSELYRQDHRYRFIIAGSYPTQDLRRLTQNPGVELREEPPDLADCLKDCSIAVFPFTFSTGIKNKVLESAAMGKYSIVSQCIYADFPKGEAPPLEVCRTAPQWKESIQALAASTGKISQQRELSSRWVSTFHDWDRTCLRMLEFAQESLSLTDSEGATVPLPTPRTQTGD
ncbi:MAG: glycosyltransferase [Bdellovibrionaceae bacterium]|nr:glycosyltransferase [Bdellovibrionales bacterium]MCB9255314.1 glycosyltransferase [Pseudobdellovibrionaceae bacterium]